MLSFGKKEPHYQTNLKQNDMYCPATNLNCESTGCTITKCAINEADKIFNTNQPMTQDKDFEKEAEGLAKDYAGKNQFRTVGNGWNYDELKQAFLDGFQARQMSTDKYSNLENQVVELLGLTGCHNVIEVINLFKSKKLDKVSDSWDAGYNRCYYDTCQIHKPSIIPPDKSTFLASLPEGVDVNQRCIGFAEWCSRQLWEYFESDNIWIKCRQDWGNGKATEQLYEQYLTDLTKK